MLMGGSKDDEDGCRCAGCGSWVPDPIRAYALKIQLGLGGSGIFSARVFCSECFVKIDTTMNGEKTDGFKSQIDRLTDFLMGRLQEDPGARSP